MSPKRIICVVAVLTTCCAFALSQDAPYLYTLTSPKTGEHSTYLHYDAAYGEQTFEPFGADNVEQTLGLHASLGETFTVVAHAGLALDNGISRTSQQAEILGRLMSGESNVVDLSAGMGFRHEYSGTDVLLSRVVLGHRFTSWQLFGNLFFEKAFAANRDDVDLFVTAGLSHNLSETVRVAIEAVGQDLEGFWDKEEAEGGATIFVGPDINVAFPGTSCALTLGGGLIVRATQSVRISDAPRDVPIGRKNGFVVRTFVCFGI